MCFGLAFPAHHHVDHFRQQPEVQPDALDEPAVNEPDDRSLEVA